MSVFLRVTGGQVATGRDQPADTGAWRRARLIACLCCASGAANAAAGAIGEALLAAHAVHAHGTQGRRTSVQVVLHPLYPPAHEVPLLQSGAYPRCNQGTRDPLHATLNAGRSLSVG